MIREIQEAVSIPVMAKCRIGHFVEAQILEALEVDYIDESEVLTPADVEHHVDKHAFTVPFVCGATNLGEALRRIAEGAAMIRTKGEAGTGDIVNAVTHMRSVFGAIRGLQGLREEELYAAAKEHRAPYELVRWVAENGRLPVVTFTAGGIATPADAALCMQLGADGVFVGSGIFKSGGTSSSTATAGRRTSPGARRRSSRRRRTSTTRRSSPTSPPVSASRWSASPRARSPRRSGSKCAAGRPARADPANGPDLHFVAMDRTAPDRRSRPARGVPRARARAARAPARTWSRCGCPEQLDGLDGLVIPGGESTTITKLAALYGLDEAIRSFERPIFGTCAGMILLDRAHLGLADIEVDRNAYGRQVASFEADLELDGDDAAVPRRLHPRAARARRRPGRRGAGRARRRAGAAPRRQGARRRVPPRADRRSADPRTIPRAGHGGDECQGIASGRRSSTRRAPPTRSAASSSRSSRARSWSRRRRAARIPARTSRCRTRSRRRARTRCRRTTSSARSRRAPARGPTARASRRSSTRATGPRASR